VINADSTIQPFHASQSICGFRMAFQDASFLAEYRQPQEPQVVGWSPCMKIDPADMQYAALVLGVEGQLKVGGEMQVYLTRSVYESAMRILLPERTIRISDASDFGGLKAAVINRQLAIIVDDDNNYHFDCRQCATDTIQYGGSRATIAAEPDRVPTEVTVSPFSCTNDDWIVRVHHPQHGFPIHPLAALGLTGKLFAAMELLTKRLPAKDNVSVAFAILNAVSRQKDAEPCVAV
jgi:hypothetical protein